MKALHYCNEIGNMHNENDTYVKINNDSDKG